MPAVWWGDELHNHLPLGAHEVTLKDAGVSVAAETLGSYFFIISM